MSAVSGYPDAFAWAAVAPHGHPTPYICTGAVRRSRSEAAHEIGAVWADDPRVGWKRAYRRGYRVIRVRVSAAFDHKGHGHD